MSGALSWALSHPNTVTYVPTGNYTLSYRVNGFANGTTLIGNGKSNTKFHFIWDYTGRTDAQYGANWFFGFQPTDVSNITLKQFSITGDGCISFNTSTINTHDNLIEDVTVENTSNIQITSFGSWVGSGLIADGYQFIRCTAYNTGGDGFDIWGRGGYVNGGLHTNVYFDGCKAIKCGYSCRFWDWIPGFDIGENGRVDNVTLLRCEASYNWESGFHFEGNSSSVTDATLTDCIANSNGQKNSDPRGAAFGYGCYEGMDHTYVNFSAIGNPGGDRGYRPLYDYRTDYYTYRVGIYAGPMNVVHYLNGTTAYTGTNFTEAMQWACGHTNAIVDIPRCNEIGNYSVKPFEVTESITLASGVHIYGNRQNGQWPSAFTSIIFMDSMDGFVIDSSNEIINIVLNGSHTLFGVPSAPTGLTTNIGDGYVRLNWSVPSYSGPGVLIYHIYRNDTLIWSGTSLDYNDTILVNGIIYSYKVAANNSVGWGVNTSTVQATPTATTMPVPPGAPINFHVSARNASVYLSWSAPSSNGSAALLGYRIYRGTSLTSMKFLPTPVTATTYMDTGLTNGQIYYYKVCAYSSAGNGAMTDPLYVTPSSGVVGDNTMLFIGIGVIAILAGACVAVAMIRRRE
jgi:hypothetical protein